MLPDPYLCLSVCAHRLVTMDRLCRVDGAPSDAYYRDECSVLGGMLLAPTLGKGGWRCPGILLIRQVESRVVHVTPFTPDVKFLTHYDCMIGTYHGS